MMIRKGYVRVRRKMGWRGGCTSYAQTQCVPPTYLPTYLPTVDIIYLYDISYSAIHFVKQHQNGTVKRLIYYYYYYYFQTNLPVAMVNFLDREREI